MIGEKTDVIVNGYAVSFVVMACHNEKDLFNKIMMVNPVSLSSLKQMPGKKEKLLRRCLEIPVFGTLVYHMVVSRDAVNNDSLRIMHLIRSIRTETCRMHIMRQRTEAVVMQRMFMQIKHPNI